MRETTKKIKQLKFQRRPTSIRKNWNKETLITSPTQNEKQLKLQNKVLSLTVSETNKSDPERIESLLFTNQKQPCEPRPYKLDTLLNESDNSNIFFQYSPSIIYPHRHQKTLCEDSFMLIEVDQNDFNKYELSTNVRRENLFESEEQLLRDTLCSSFSLNDDQILVTSTRMRVSLISMNNYIFRINYLPRLQTFSETVTRTESNSLVNRLHRKLKNEPLKLFPLLKLISNDHDSRQLRSFLIQNSVKYSTAQILDLQSKLTNDLMNYRPYQILQNLFLKGSNEQMLVLNLSHDLNRQYIDIADHNFWTAFSIYFQKHHDNPSKSNEMFNLKNFISKVL